MLYRLFIATIVLFWLTMAGLLLRRELGPGDTSLRAVPMAHVARLMLTHEQASDLQIFSDKSNVGRMQIRPRVRKEDGQRQIDFGGSLNVALPGMARQRIGWMGELALDSRLETERFKVAVSFRDPASYAVELVLDPATREVQVETRTGPQRIRRASYSLDENGLRTWLRDLGFDPTLLMSLHDAHSSPLVMRALQSSLAVRGEKVETYLISAEQGEQTLLEAHVSQLGQILRVRTIAGYAAAPEGLQP